MEGIISTIISSIKNISIWSILDILVVSYIFYKAYKLIKETRAEQLIKGVVLVFLLIPISYILNLDMLYFILNKTLTIGVLSFVIIFQPEIRRALEHLGRSAFDERHHEIKEEEETLDEIVVAVENLSKTKTGALIVIEQSTGLGEIVTSGTIIDAKVSSALLENIFVVNTPLHDGATIIKKGRIHASGCVLPLTSNNRINKKLGTRHRAGLGISENSDALIIIVSEETGVISLAYNGKLTRNYDKDKLKSIILKLMINKKNKNVDTARKRVKIWAKEKIKK
ncbi:MAG: diadenylate cyclase CdaA [Clostridium sp.]|nr:diadenylate cyclase CdaA [Clostridium sp.]